MFVVNCVRWRKPKDNTTEKSIIRHGCSVSDSHLQDLRLRPASKGTHMLYFRWMCELATRLAIKFRYKTDRPNQNTWLDCKLYLQFVICNGQDDGGISRRVEAALLAHLSSEESFPCKDKSARVLPMLADHLNLTLREEDPKTWSAVEAVFRRAHPWAVSHGDVFFLVGAGCVIDVAVCGGVGVSGGGVGGGGGGGGGGASRRAC